MTLALPANSLPFSRRTCAAGHPNRGTGFQPVLHPWCPDTLIPSPDPLITRSPLREIRLMLVLSLSKGFTLHQIPPGQLCLNCLNRIGASEMEGGTSEHPPHIVGCPCSWGRKPLFGVRCARPDKMPEKTCVFMRNLIHYCK